MKVQVEIHGHLKNFTQGIKSLELEANYLSECLGQLVSKFPELGSKLFDNQQTLHKFINIYVNEEDIRFLKDTQTSLEARDVISIIPSISGG